MCESSNQPLRMYIFFFNWWWSSYFRVFLFSTPKQFGNDSISLRPITNGFTWLRLASICWCYERKEQLSTSIAFNEFLTHRSYWESTPRSITISHIITHKLRSLLYNFIFFSYRIIRFFVCLFVRSPCNWSMNKIS